MSGWLGVTTLDLSSVADVVEQGRGRKLHLGLQLYVSRNGECLVDAAYGEDAPGVPLTPDHRMLWLSSGKPITAAATLLLWQRGDFDLDDTVAEHLPEFANSGKESVTIRHLLTHTAGLRSVPIDWTTDDWETALQKVYAAPLDPDAIPGTTAGYHVASTWFLLGELISRWTKKSFVASLRELIFDPVGMSRTICGVDADGTIESEVFATMYRRERGEAVRSDLSEPAVISRPAPGANTRGPARDLGRFYEALLGVRRTEQPWLSPQTIEAMTARHRVGKFDLTLQHVVDYGLGVIVNSRMYGEETVPYGFGFDASPRAFGHGGAQSSIGYAAPESGLVVCVAFNGMPGEGQHQRRANQFLKALETDLARHS